MMRLAPGTIYSKLSLIASGGACRSIFDTKFLDALKVFLSHNLPLGMYVEPILTSLTVYQCSDIDWAEKAAQDGFILYDFQSDEVCKLKTGFFRPSNACGKTTVPQHQVLRRCSLSFSVPGCHASPLVLWA